MNVPILDLKPAYEELRPELDAAYQRVMDSGWLLLGRELEAFEAEYAASVGVKHCIGVANGLEAMQLVLMALGIGPGDEVIVPSHGYIATWLAVTHVGATPVPCESDPRTYNLDAAQVAAAITPRTKAILPIHLYGQTADMNAINAVASQHGLFVLEDAAQSHGARCHGRDAGALGGAAGVSFYPSKNLGAMADAGAVTTSDDALADKLRHLRNYGSKVRYQNEYLGLNSRLSELQAAFLRAKLPRLAEWNARRSALAELYQARLGGVGDLVLPFVPAWASPVWHLFVIRTSRRNALQQHLTAHGVGTQIHYPVPPHLSRAYAGAGWKRGDFPLAETLADQVLSLPIGPHVTAAQVEFVCAQVTAFFQAG
ncbi:DegT/DnrJ/EryC1/StrS family aminotransferase [Horticoccus sp. 23ND18S-11]|uniref:DegT/DnrJ/EryC1/StrS family aminotransferase n=1 Tax=Horticoccus sp. 23ND18S-11 TaxID=3391832 RepID=UPI0039C9AEB2